MISERYHLAIQRIAEIKHESVIQEPFGNYFLHVASFLEKADELKAKILSPTYFTETSQEELRLSNKGIYEEQNPAMYTSSYLNPAYAKEKLGEEHGGLLSFLFTELQAIIPMIYEQNEAEIAIRAELFLQVYTTFLYAYEEEKGAPDAESIREILYWYISDYTEPETEKRVREQLDPESKFAFHIIMDSDLSDLRYLYRFGEYVTDTELDVASYLLTLPEEQIQRIASTFTEGFRKGFALAGKDLRKKDTVNIRYVLGFERIIRQAVMDFEIMGLKPVIYRAGSSIFDKNSHGKVGYFGAICNQQYEYDHREDLSLFLDGHLVTRKLECLREAYRELEERAAKFAGPACMEVFGETPFAPLSQPAAASYSANQLELVRSYTAEAGKIVNTYIRREERSFTIIAFPTPQIGPDFPAIFSETVDINTLDYHLYERIQQTIIDTLNRADYVHVKGANGNETDINVMLMHMDDPAHQTLFENCVADVNIPVGEVFTSPRLQGTNGLLHVSRVFLKELEYRDLRLTFKDGYVSEYSCANFDTQEENQKFIKDNLLFHYPSLPLGEFAIGTNTVAYTMARKYGIEDKLPILIAEKMGPHFAVGDTCYSEEEDVRVYNPDGKEIIAKENETSALRKENPAKAYFRCHTDITIPYHELALLEAMTGTGERIPIISDGRFVLSGCEELNVALEKATKSV